MIKRAGGRQSRHDNPGPFKQKVVQDEADLLDSINRRRCQIGLSSRALDDKIGKGIDLGTIISRGSRTKTSSIFHFLDALDLELVIRPKEKTSRLQRAIDFKKLTQSADDTGGVPAE